MVENTRKKIRWLRQKLLNIKRRQLYWLRTNKIELASKMECLHESDMMEHIIRNRLVELRTQLLKRSRGYKNECQSIRHRIFNLVRFG